MGYSDDPLMVESDKYAMDKGKFDQLAGVFGKDVCPVDMNYGYIVQSKNDKSNLDKTEQNIQERFNLESKE